jgi:hypothetical protein
MRAATAFFDTLRDIADVIFEVIETRRRPLRGEQCSWRYTAETF